MVNDGYTYVLNNPLKYTDPSGYTYYWKRYEWERKVTESMNFNSGGGGVSRRDGRSYHDYIDSMHEDPSAWDYDPYSQELYNHRTAETIPMSLDDILANINLTEMCVDDAAALFDPNYQRTVLGTDKYGNLEVLYEDANSGFMKVSKVPFWEVSGSYYNHDYFVSGVEAYGDMKFVMGLIGSKLDYSALIPAAFSLELNGSAEFYGAISTTPIGIIAAIRGQSAGNIRSFNSSGLGFGGASASTQFVKMRYHYFGSISNFSLENTFYGPSIDIEFSAGVFGVVAGTHVSLMFNATHQGDFMIGFGSYIGGGLPGLSGSGTYQSTDKW